MAIHIIKGAILAACLLCNALSTTAFNIAQNYGRVSKSSVNVIFPHNSIHDASIPAFNTGLGHNKNVIRQGSTFKKRYRNDALKFSFNADHGYSHYGIRQGLALNLSSSNNEDIDSPSDDPYFSWQSVFQVVGAQSILIILAIIAGGFLHVPNYGLGQNFLLDERSLQCGALYTLPLFGLAFVLDKVEDSIPQLQDVTKATQRSVIALMGGTRKPLIALGISVLMGTAAGLGEEMLFRGILQTKLSENFGDFIALSSSAVIFGLLHAVTPLYAGLAFLASLFFGQLYLTFDNLAVPIICHGLYDIGALLWAHYVVTEMAEEDRMAIVLWEAPNETQIK